MSTHLKVLRSTAVILRQPVDVTVTTEINTERERIIRKPEKSEKNKVIKNCSENYLNLKTDVEIQGSYETPKSYQNKIPKSLECPQAPTKKPIRRIEYVSCKRKLMPELEFFESDKRKEVDEFLKSSFERISNSNAKRKCSTASADVIIVGTTCALSTESSLSS